MNNQAERIDIFRKEGRPVFACHIQDYDADWKMLRDGYIGASWSDTGGNSPEMTIFFSPSAQYGPQILDLLKEKFAKFLLQ